jgi:NADPH-dependent glutamate synthase beta subunit-like oxidoreductase
MRRLEPGLTSATTRPACYFCHDAPCMTACPTAIDIPLFIRQISTGNPLGAAKTIFDQNILGGMCARVCPPRRSARRPACARWAEGKPVEIGRLQRYATDIAMENGKQFYRRSRLDRQAPSRIVGAGPAGLAAAHRLAMHGHHVTIFEAKERLAASTNTASPPTRPPTTSPRRRSIISCARRHHDRFGRPGAGHRLQARRPPGKA